MEQTYYDSFGMNIFTNCTVNAPSIYPMCETFESFVKTFDLDVSKLDLSVYIDPHPVTEQFDNFKKNLEQYFKTTHNIEPKMIKSKKSKSLAKRMLLLRAISTTALKTS